jgi:hypothetical protein
VCSGYEQFRSLASATPRFHKRFLHYRVAAVVGIVVEINLSNAAGVALTYTRVEDVSVSCQLWVNDIQVVTVTVTWFRLEP